MQLGNWIHPTNKTQQQKLAAYGLHIIFTFVAVIPLYINSNFLTSIVTEQITGSTYTIAAIITIGAIAASSRALRQLGNYATVLSLTILELAALLTLAFAGSVWLLLFAFIIHWILTAAIRYHLDVFLESYSDDATTGETRGTLSALRHVAFIIGPLIAGLVLGEKAFDAMYLTAAVFVLPAILLLMYSFRDFEDPDYAYNSLWASLRTAWKDVNVRWTLLCMLTLRLFFAWMVVYTPIYLHQHIGLPFDEIGVIFSIMLLPYVLMGRGLGEIADQWLGEKELLITGFIITAGFTASLALVETQEIIIWGLLLFGTRVGATMVQVMSAGYFFKHINAGAINELSLARMVKPIAYVLAPALATGMLAIGSFTNIFLWIAGITLLGALAAVPIADTR
jgi:MFS family permease